MTVGRLLNFRSPFKESVNSRKEARADLRGARYKVLSIIVIALFSNCRIKEKTPPANLRDPPQSRVKKSFACGHRRFNA
jgi:hypothetical protein